MNIIQKLKSLLIIGIRYLYPNLRLVSKEEYKKIKFIYELVITGDESNINIAGAMAITSFSRHFRSDESDNLQCTLYNGRTKLSFFAFSGHQINIKNWKNKILFLEYPKISLYDQDFEMREDAVKFILKLDKLIIW